MSLIITALCLEWAENCCAHKAIQANVHFWFVSTWIDWSSWLRIFQLSLETLFPDSSQCLVAELYFSTLASDCPIIQTSFLRASRRVLFPIARILNNIRLLRTLCNDISVLIVCRLTTEDSFTFLCDFSAKCINGENKIWFCHGCIFITFLYYTPIVYVSESLINN